MREWLTAWMSRCGKERVYQSSTYPTQEDTERVEAGWLASVSNFTMCNPAAIRQRRIVHRKMAFRFTVGIGFMRECRVRALV